jgi:quinol monooxygenase YgiN
MIKIVAENYVKKEHLEEFLDLVSELVKESRKEDGCISYTLYEDISDQTHLTFIEEWKDADAINTHNNSKHFTSIVPKLGRLLYKEGTVVKYLEEEFKMY